METLTAESAQRVDRYYSVLTAAMQNSPEFAQRVNTHVRVTSGHVNVASFMRAASEDDKRTVIYDCLMAYRRKDFSALRTAVPDVGRDNAPIIIRPSVSAPVSFQPRVTMANGGGGGLATGGTLLKEAHEQWRDRPADQRFETLEVLRDRVHSRRRASQSKDLIITDVKPEDTGSGIVINSAIHACEPTHWSFGQLAQTIKAPAGYLRTLPRPLLVDCLGHGLRNADRERVKFLTIEPEGDNPSTLQAVTSSTYGRIWDADVVEAVMRIRERTGGKFYNPKARIDGMEKQSGLYASDHDVFMFMIDGGSLLDVGPRAQLNRGFIVWNSETGAKSFGLMTFLFNKVCGNHLIWGAQDVNKLVIRHTSGGPMRFDYQAAPTLKAYVEASARPIEAAVRKAQDYLLPDKTDLLADWANKHGKFTGNEVKQAIAFAKAEDGGCRTLWQFVQGLTAYARGFDYIDTRVDLEKRAGSLLNLVNN